MFYLCIKNSVLPLKDFSLVGKVSLAIPDTRRTTGGKKIVIYIQVIIIKICYSQNNWGY